MSLDNIKARLKILHDVPYDVSDSTTTQATIAAFEKAILELRQEIEAITSATTASSDAEKKILAAMQEHVGAELASLMQHLKHQHQDATGAAAAATERDNRLVEFRKKLSGLQSAVNIEAMGKTIGTASANRLHAFHTNAHVSHAHVLQHTVALCGLPARTSAPSALPTIETTLRNTGHALAANGISFKDKTSDTPAAKDGYRYDLKCDDGTSYSEICTYDVVKSTHSSEVKIKLAPQASAIDYDKLAEFEVAAKMALLRALYSDYDDKAFSMLVSTATATVTAVSSPNNPQQQANNDRYCAALIAAYKRHGVAPSPLVPLPAVPVVPAASTTTSTASSAIASTNVTPIVTPVSSAASTPTEGRSRASSFNDSISITDEAMEEYTVDIATREAGQVDTYHVDIKSSSDNLDTSLTDSFHVVINSHLPKEDVLSVDINSSAANPTERFQVGIVTTIPGPPSASPLASTAAVVNTSMNSHDIYSLNITAAATNATKK